MIGFTVAAGLGAGVFLILGVAHAVFTLQSSPSSGPMTPTDPEVQTAMQRPGGLGLAPQLELTLFRAWTGFNLSHSLGIVVVAAMLLGHVISDFEAALSVPWFLVLVVVVPPVYLWLSIRYWFEDPTRGITIGLLLLWVGVGGGLLVG